MSTDQTLAPELDPGPSPVGTRIRNLLAIPGRLLGVLVIPDRIMPVVVRQRRSAAAFLALIFCGLASAYVIGARIDTTSSVLQQEIMMQKMQGPDYEARSDRELKEEIAKERTVEQVALGLKAGLLTPLTVFFLGLVVFFTGRYVGGRTTFGGAMAAAANASLPMAVKAVVVGLMAWPSEVLTPDGAAALRQIAILAPQGGGFMTFLSVDAFLLWSVLLLGFGLAAAGQMTRRRSFVTIFICFALFQLWTGGAAGPMGGPGAGPTMLPPGGAR